MEVKKNEMDWREVLMGALTGAIIIAAAAIVAALITEVVSGVRGTRSIRSILGDPPNTTLAGQHTQIQNELKNEHAQIQNEQARLAASLDKSVAATQEIQTQLRVNAAQYETLTDAQKTMGAHIAALRQMEVEMARLQQEVVELRRENEQLRRHVYDRHMGQGRTLSP